MTQAQNDPPASPTGDGTQDPKEASPTRQLTEDEVFVLDLRQSFQDFYVKQSEILRVAGYVDDKQVELDDKRENARKMLIAELDDELNEGVFDRLMDLLSWPILEGAPVQEGDTELGRENFVRIYQDLIAEAPDGHFPAYLDVAMRAQWAEPSGDLLYGSLLVTLVGALETMINEVARLTVKRVPSTLATSERSWTWAELSVFESLDQARDDAVDKMVDKLFRGSLNDWIDFFVEKYKISPIAAAKTFEAQEIIQRRHCIVHNGGRASPQYDANLKQYGRPKAQGEQLNVDLDYLRRASDQTLLIAYSLVWSLTAKLCASGKTRDRMWAYLTDMTYRLLQAQRFDLVKEIGRMAPRDALSEQNSLTIQINTWLAHKFDGSFDEVRDQVSDFDIMAKSKVFQLAKLALLDDHEKASSLAEAMMRDQELPRSYYLTWPLLAGTREYQRTHSDSNQLDKPPVEP